MAQRRSLSRHRSAGLNRYRSAHSGSHTSSGCTCEVTHGRRASGARPAGSVRPLLVTVSSWAARRLAPCRMAPSLDADLIRRPTRLAALRRSGAGTPSIALRCPMGRTRWLTGPRYAASPTSVHDFAATDRPRWPRLARRHHRQVRSTRAGATPEAGRVQYWSDLIAHGAVGALLGVWFVTVAAVSADATGAFRLTEAQFGSLGWLIVGIGTGACFILACWALPGGFRVTGRPEIRRRHGSDPR